MYYNTCGNLLIAPQDARLAYQPRLVIPEFNGTTLRNRSLHVTTHPVYSPRLRLRGLAYNLFIVIPE